MPDGRLVIFSGVTRSGKTVAAVEALTQHKYRMIWDADAQHKPETARTLCRTRAELLAAVKSGAAGINYRPAGNLAAEFDYWCKVAFWYGKVLAGRGESLGVLAEETADVTSPGKAPEGWGILVRRALKRGISIYAVTQRPAESDKTAFGNASLIHCCKLVRQADARYMANEMACDPDEITGMVMDQSRGIYDYLLYTPGNGTLSRGRLTFTKGGKPRFSPR